MTETWLQEDADVMRYEMKEFKTDLNSKGRGKGVASYFNKKFHHIMNTNCDGFGMFPHCGLFGYDLNIMERNKREVR